MDGAENRVWMDRCDLLLLLVVCVWPRTCIVFFTCFGGHGVRV